MSPAGNSKKSAPGKPFVKGQSGNPTGRPKADPEVTATLKAATPKAATKLAALVDSSDPDIAMKASIAILDRVLGKPAQVIKGDGEDGSITVRVVTYAAGASDA